MKQHIKILICTLIWITGISGCQIPKDQHNNILFHGFKFDALADSVNIKIIDYRYGTSRWPTAANNANLRLQGESFQATSIMGDMRRGADLYVKWQNTSTGRISEQTVDLSKVPDKDIRDHTVYFIVDNDHLYVYLISIKPTRALLKPRDFSHLLDLAEGPRERTLFRYVRHDIKEIFPNETNINPLDKLPATSR